MYTVLKKDNSWLWLSRTPVKVGILSLQYPLLNFCFKETHSNIYFCVIVMIALSAASVSYKKNIPTVLLAIIYFDETIKNNECC